MEQWNLFGDDNIIERDLVAAGISRLILEELWHNMYYGKVQGNSKHGA